MTGDHDFIRADAVDPSSHAGAAWPARPIRRVAVVSLHTSPLAQPGGGDAGGMNVYVDCTARELSALGIQVDVYTRRTDPETAPVVGPAPGVRVISVPAGPPSRLEKSELPGLLCAFAGAALTLGSDYDVVHSHYWLSGQAALAMAAGWRAPHVHSPHTLGRVKNRAQVPGAHQEPARRVRGEEQVVAAADRIVVNTAAESAALVELYGARSERIDVIAPGVDVTTFVPGPRDGARERLGIPRGESVIAFAGRIQPMKGPDVLVRALARLRDRDPARRWRLLAVGAGSGPERRGRSWLADLAAAEGVADALDLRAPMPAVELADAFRAADLVAVPSHQESFGLVALEAQAVGTPVLAAAVGGLPVAVADGRTGRLITGHDPDQWARAIVQMLADDDGLARMSAAGVARAAEFSWAVTARRLLACYQAARRGGAGGPEGAGPPGETSAPGGAAPGPAAPRGTVAGGTVAGGTLAGGTLAGPAAPGGAMPGPAVPGPAVPGATVPGRAT